jgi:hypothetical protein
MVGSVSHFAGRLFTPATVLAVLETEDLLTEETAEENIVISTEDYFILKSMRLGWFAVTTALE